MTIAETAGAATGIALGDVSSVLAAAPALVGQLACSRDAERAQRWKESDEVRRLGADIDVGIAFSSHPADAERIAFFRAASR